MTPEEKFRQSCAVRAGDLEPEARKMLEWRGISQDDEVCQTCGGSGVRAYPDTATWHGGIGGQQITSDVCNKCWGSGCLNRKGPDLRLMDARMVEHAEKMCQCLEHLQERGYTGWYEDDAIAAFRKLKPK